MYQRQEPRGEWREIEIAEGTSIEEVYRAHRDQMRYTALAAKVDNKIEDLGYVLTKPCSLELLDMRTQSANLIYQYSLSPVSYTHLGKSRKSLVRRYCQPDYI